MISYILRFKYWDNHTNDYGMKFEDDISDFEAEKFIEDFLIANEFKKRSDGTWIAPNNTIVTVIKEEENNA